MVTVKLRKPITSTQLAHLVARQPGTVLHQRPDGFDAVRGDKRVRVKITATKAGAKVRVVPVYPWWTWLGLLAGVVGAVVTTLVYAGIAKPLVMDVKAAAQAV